MEFKGKALAELRNKEIKEMVMKLEQQRDELYDEIANRKGRVEVIEGIIKDIYDRIVQVNKDVQQQALKEEVEKRAREEEEKKKAEEKETFEKSKRGIKTPKPKRRKRTKKSKD